MFRYRDPYVELQIVLFILTKEKRRKYAAVGCSSGTLMLKVVAENSKRA